MASITSNASEVHVGTIGLLDGIERPKAFSSSTFPLYEHTSL